MENPIPNSGSIEVVCGPMFSGKTEELIRRLRLAEAAGRRIQVFKPTHDTRYSESEIVTHADDRMAAASVTCAREILLNVSPGTEVVGAEVIGIDEAHFFGSELLPVCDQMANLGKQVIVAGLDTDFLGRPFPPIPELLALAESITKTFAVCAVCGAPAKHSQRLLASRELILVGASNAYEARCRRCFQPGALSADPELCCRPCEPHLPATPKQK